VISGARNIDKIGKNTEWEKKGYWARQLPIK